MLFIFQVSSSASSVDVWIETFLALERKLLTLMPNAPYYTDVIWKT